MSALIFGELPESGIPGRAVAKPAPRVRGDALVDALVELRLRPGEWAVIADLRDMQVVKARAYRFRRHGCETAARATRDGWVRLWARWIGPTTESEVGR